MSHSKDSNMSHISVIAPEATDRKGWFLYTYNRLLDGELIQFKRAEPAYLQRGLPQEVITQHAQLS